MCRLPKSNDRVRDGSPKWRFERIIEEIHTFMLQLLWIDAVWMLATVDL